MYLKRKALDPWMDELTGPPPEGFLSQILSSTIFVLS